MVGTIAPLVEGRKSDRVWGWLAGVGHVVTSGLGGATFGALVAWAGGWAFNLVLPSNVAKFAVSTGITALYVFRELGMLPLPVIDVKTAVPNTWRERLGYGPGALIYGFVLAFGFTARTPYSSFHLMMLWLAAIGDIRWGLTVGAIWGLTRGVVPLFMHAVGWSNSRLLNSLFLGRVEVHIANGWMEGFTAAITLAALILPT